ncbi:MAG: hypothetical protein JW852_02225 [Spirochaetales bacterium]|nr:hypothetical protein [Spirochaetales bacterium]
MDKRMLIIPGDSDMSVALAEEASIDGWTVALTRRGKKPGAGQGKNPLIIGCNGRSFLSTRRSFIDCINAFGGLDAAIVLHEARQDERPVHELNPVAIEEYVDTEMKGHLFLLREVLSFFVRNRSGILAMVNYAPEDSTLLPLCAAATAAFHAVTDSIATLYQNENIVINGFDCSVESPQRYSRFILQQLSGRAGDVSGKWYRYGAAGRLSRPRLFRK